MNPWAASIYDMQLIYVNLERDHLLFKLSANDVVACSLQIPRSLKKSGKYTGG